jgi:hypothetical protein
LLPAVPGRTGSSQFPKARVGRGRGGRGGRKALRIQAPTSKIVLTATLPRPNDFSCSRIARVTAVTEKPEDRDPVRFLGPGARFPEGPGRVKPAFLVPDQPHLSEAGHREGADGLEPLLKDRVDRP